MQNKNFLLFAVLTAAILIGWWALNTYVFPPPAKPNKPAVTAKDEGKGKPEEAKPDREKEKPAEKPAVAEALKPVPPTPLGELIPLGDADAHSPFHLRVLLDPRGAGVASVLLNKFPAANSNGEPEWQDAAKKVPVPLKLVPEEAEVLPGQGAVRMTPSIILRDFDVKDPSDDKPLDTLARIKWEQVGDREEETLPDGRLRQRVAFQTESQGVVLTKIYTLTQGDYHIGLEVKMKRTAGAGDKLKVRYQLTGAHALPVEGKWYTSVFRNALIAWEEGGSVYRDLQDLRQIAHWGGGNEVGKEGNRRIRYAGVAVQYFASVIVVDNEQQNQDFLKQVRPTLETALTRGVVESVAEDRSSFVLRTDKTEETFQVAETDREKFRPLRKGSHIAVVHHTGPYNEKTREYPEIATQFGPEEATPPVWVDDITVRVSTEAIDLKDAEVSHKYLLYNGPVKVSQLGSPPGLARKPLDNGGVPAELVDRYHDTLHLNTLTDYHSPGLMGKFASTIYWTALVIKCTNLMHLVLGYIHALIPSYGLCIIVLTILVRGMMFPLSRKQALMSLRMQQLGPELKKLQEKFKDDRQALGMAQMDLYRKHGVNPFGSCWVLLLQMPIFMGLYFALQESIHFRLAEFWPTWISNLAAPDMLFGWSQRIPIISSPDNYSGGMLSFLYLGPYFNLLPVIAVTLMIFQQKMMTPPPADEQAAMQQKMMKYMMAFMGLMFYKVAAGLCLYFIASSAWGFCERKLLPKRKLDTASTPPPPEGYFQKLLRRASGEPSTAVTTGNGGITPAASLEARGPRGKHGRGKRRERGPESLRARPGAGPQETDGSPLGRLRRWLRQRRDRLREWWIQVLKQAEKK